MRMDVTCSQRCVCVYTLIYIYIYFILELRPMPIGTCISYRQFLKKWNRNPQVERSGASKCCNKVLCNIHSLKRTAKAPENRPGPKRKQSSSNHPFSGANNTMLVSGRVCPGFRPWRMRILWHGSQLYSKAHRATTSVTGLSKHLFLANCTCSRVGWSFMLVKAQKNPPITMKVPYFLGQSWRLIVSHLCFVNVLFVHLWMALPTSKLPDSCQNNTGSPFRTEKLNARG